MNTNQYSEISQKIKSLSCLALALALTGCWTDRHGTRHTVIIGFGIVGVTPTNSAATVVSVHCLGLNGSRNGINAGYSSSLTTSVPANAEDVRIETSQHPFAPIKINVQKTQLKEQKQTNQQTK